MVHVLSCCCETVMNIVDSNITLNLLINTTIKRAYVYHCYSNGEVGDVRQNGDLFVRNETRTTKTINIFTISGCLLPRYITRTVHLDVNKTSIIK